MSSRAAKRRNKKRAIQHDKPQQAGRVAQLVETATTGHHTARPTPERLAHGVWAEPQGGAKDQQPIVDLASDMIGALYQRKQITTSQEQAARLFQELRAGYLSELGTVGFGSCLADNQSGYDGGDGDAAVIAAYRNLERKIGRVKTAIMLVECDKGPDRQPHDLGALRNAMDCVNGA